MSRAGAAGQQGARRAAWKPSDDPGAIRWWRADLGKTIPGGISAWEDQIEGAVLSQGVPADQPTEGTSINGQATIEFSNNEYLQGMGFVSIAQRWLMYAVLEITGANATQEALEDGGGISNSPRLRWSAGQWRISAGTLLATGDTTLGGVSAWLTDANGVLSKGYRNNFTTPLVTGDAGSSATDSLTVGARDNGSSPITGAIAEVVLTTTLSPVRYRRYFGDRYGLVIG